MSDEIDPEIAALIGEDDQGRPPAYPGSEGPAAGGPGTPDFRSLFGEMGAPPPSGPVAEFEVDLSRKGFATIEKLENEKPEAWFSDPSYYKLALGGEGEEAQKLHDILGKYLKTTDPKDKGVYRQQIVPAYWYLASKMALHSVGAQAALAKKLAVRYGALLPAVMGPELADLFQRIFFEKVVDEPVYYVDEWIRAIATGKVQPSATDEVKSRPKGDADDRSRFTALIQKAQGKRDAAEGITKSKSEERRRLESLLKERVEQICAHEIRPGGDIPSPYADSQKKLMSELSEITRRMVAVDKELSQTLSDYDRAGEELREVGEKSGGLAQEAKADMQTLAQEFETVRQMTKLCIGRQGNHFPILSREYFHGGIKDVGTRENVIRLLAWIESIDCEAFCRSYKSALNRIVPFIILLPCYGDQGICWEPFERHNRATSRGRIALPLYPKSLPLAVVTAVADLRWQVAKEKASYYWMEEGLTGNYYQWFVAKKIKGDVKEYFIQDYLLWVTKESEGIQKLDKEVRGVFWRYMPFSKEIKEKLKTRSYVYQELYQKDVNRTLSDGY